MSAKSIENLLEKQFKERFGREPQARTWAPGRVNIIGEHTDYNGGYVLPIAIGKKIFAGAAASDNDTVTLRSGNLKGEVVFDLDAVESSGDWGDYPKGIVAKLLDKGYPVRGFNAFFLSNLPIGAGVSSSAAMEVVVCYLLQKLFDFRIPPEDSALLCQQAEHDFGGTQCGIMDQFVSIMGLDGNAIFLDCRTLDHRQVPFRLREHVLVACDSRVKRELAVSAYNQRRAECEQGARTLNERIGGIRELRDANLAQLEECSSHMPEKVFRRCRHVVTENQRVLASVEALEHNDIVKLGELMNLSHDSLRNDYEVSCEELDLLVETARSLDGVVGSRLTGAGFGGSTIAIVHRASVDAFQRGMAESYLDAFGIMPRFFECVPSNGAEQAQS